MALVVVRGAIFGEFADHVASEAIIALVVFSGIGWGAGWIIEYVVRDSVEANFRRRVEWYRQGIIDAGLLEDNSAEES
ncbi:hypothetical protein [Novipirellula rosea]|uniref:Uncharacterized protein n=1 Tax=Novipirellula rosea TaxID=1031540 RepID=A0ABP8MF56_9BACT